MQFWIDKENEKEPSDKWENAYVFSINRKKYSTIFTNITNCWYRMDRSVSIPVLEYEKWKPTEHQWENVLCFLTGDHWYIHFRKSQIVYSYRKYSNRIHLNVQDCDCVCLFSGGLDSFCGAIKLLEEGASPCLIGHNEYPKLAKKQIVFADTFQSNYPGQTVRFVSFTANSRAPLSKKEGELRK